MASLTEQGGPGSLAQVGVLVRVRWQMLRPPWVRLLFGLVAVMLPAVVIAGAAAAQLLAPGLEVEVATLLASLLLLFPALTFMAGMAAGGGTEAIPAVQLVAFPLSPRAVYLTSVLLAPLNVAWTIQAVAIVWAASYVGGKGFVGGLLVMLAVLYIAATTATGLALSWLVTAVRSTWRGRRLTEALVVVAAGLITFEAIRSGAESLVERLPLSEIAVRLVLTPPSEAALWVLPLILTGAAALAAGAAATTLALQRRDDDASAREGRGQRPRPWRTGELAALLAVDWASARRSKPIRRGMALFAVIPGVAALASAMPWEDMVILPGLVATGAGLLFSVNSFALDGPGATWLESTPRDPSTAFVSKTLVTALATTLVVFGAIAIGSLRSRQSPSLETGSVVVMAAISAVIVVSALTMRASVRRPYKADLRSPRDTPAPPAAMTAHSIVLIAATTVVGIIYVITVRLPGLAPSVTLTLICVAAGLAHLWRSARLWSQPAVRARVVAGVSFG